MKYTHRVLELHIYTESSVVGRRLTTRLFQVPIGLGFLVNHQFSDRIQLNYFSLRSWRDLEEVTYTHRGLELHKDHESIVVTFLTTQIFRVPIHVGLVNLWYRKCNNHFDLIFGSFQKKMKLIYTHTALEL